MIIHKMIKIMMFVQKKRMINKIINNMKILNLIVQLNLFISLNHNKY